MKKSLKVFLLCVLMCSVSEQISGSTDPYSEIRYEDAFNFEKINKKYKKLLSQLGCAQNALPEAFEWLAEEMCLTDETIAAEYKKYQKECLAHMHKSRLNALAQPGIKSAVNIVLCLAAYYGTMQVLDSSSFGGSFAGFAYIQHALYELPDLAVTVKKMIWKPNNVLQDLENKFAVNQCFIPKNLWKKIAQTFVEARQNPFTRDSKIAFLEFALDLTVFRQPKVIFFKNSMNVHQIKQELINRIAAYFKDYDHCDSSLHAINRNVCKFVDAMLEYQITGTITKAPRYLYLHGSGGIGKTHFIKQLSGWINELLSNAVRCDDVVIESNHQLEGDDKHPGVILITLRSQLRDGKNGSMVLIDEATWLNHPCMIDAAKRVFNGNQSKISASYLNTCEVENAFALPPMLIVVANNAKIDDAALASRFDIVNFPTPSKAMLQFYADNIAKSSQYLQLNNVAVNESKIQAWIDGLPTEQCNFRYIDSNVENMLVG